MEAFQRAISVFVHPLSAQSGRVVFSKQDRKDLNGVTIQVIRVGICDVRGDNIAGLKGGF